MKNFKFKRGDCVVVTKLQNSDTSPYQDGNHPNGINSGYESGGYILNTPTIGHRFIIGESFYQVNLSTSPVIEFLSEDTFKTRNSIYKVTLLTLREDEK